MTTKLSFYWTADYKTSKAVESVDWESVKSKYKDILDLFLSALPEENTSTFDRNFPHKKSDITLQIMTSKLKEIQIKFCHAVDSGRRSEHGRVVMIYYELCKNVWGGSLATQQIGHGIESVELMPDENQENVSNSESTSAESTTSAASTITPTDDSQGSEDDHWNDKATDNSTNEDQAAVVWHRRDLLDETVKNYRQNKLKRKIPVDQQLLDCAHEELTIKKRLVDHIDRMDQKYAENMDKMSQNMETLTNSISKWVWATVAIDDLPTTSTYVQSSRLCSIHART